MFVCGQNNANSLFVLVRNLLVLGSVLLFWCEETSCLKDNEKVIFHRLAVIKISILDANRGVFHSNESYIGMYGLQSKTITEVGPVVHVKSQDGSNNGCSPPVNIPPARKWIALMERGSCKFHQKIHNAAVITNASAVVVYNHKDEDGLLTMDHNIDNVVSVFISLKHGQFLADLVDKGASVFMNISMDDMPPVFPHNASAVPLLQTTSASTPYLFICLGIIIILIGGITVLLFYAVHKSRTTRTPSGIIHETPPAYRLQTLCPPTADREGLISHDASESIDKRPSH